MKRLDIRPAVWGPYHSEPPPSSPAEWAIGIVSAILWVFIILGVFE